MDPESKFYAWIEWMRFPDKFIPNKNSAKLWVIDEQNLIHANTYWKYSILIDC